MPSAPLRRRLLAPALLLPAVAAVAPLAVATASAPLATPAAAQRLCPDAQLSPVEDPQRAANAILCLLNRERVARDLPPLRSDAALVRAARGHSSDMVRRRFFAHTAPGQVTFADRIRRARYSPGTASKLGENLAWGMGEPALPEVVVRGWMHSPEHRANVLDRTFRSIGIGIARGVPVATASSAARSGVTYTTDFGSR